MPENSSLHVAIIPDGNRRDAKRKGEEPYQGHHRGYCVLKNILNSVWDFHVTHLTFWALSFENLMKRPADEITYFLRLLEKGVDELTEILSREEHNIRFHAAGEWKEFLNPILCRKIENLERVTNAHSRPVFTLLLVYDGARELEYGMRAMEKSRNPLRTYSAFQSRVALLKNNIWTHHLPDVDLCIRTGGEPHLSAGFLMLHMANAALYFTKTLWPAFTTQELSDAIYDFQSRKRRFGA